MEPFKEFLNHYMPEIKGLAGSALLIFCSNLFAFMGGGILVVLSIVHKYSQFRASQIDLKLKEYELKRQVSLECKKTD